MAMVTLQPLSLLRNSHLCLNENMCHFKIVSSENAGLGLRCYRKTFIRSYGLHPLRLPQYSILNGPFCKYIMYFLYVQTKIQGPGLPCGGRPPSDRCAPFYWVRYCCSSRCYIQPSVESTARSCDSGAACFP